MRLIDADAMCADLATVDPRYKAMIEWGVRVTEAQPTVDAVEVVRCKDCKYCTDCITDDGMNIYYRCLKDYEKPPYCSAICPQVDEDDYCSWGERREDETN